ncbi:putative serine/threonine-protein kinase MRK1 like protein [Fusarium oxysporum f. sp. albedinis]|nr:putative serine/threonine-protein kinase MRK1 like protein [Fusarium oxysporum f. sp. albedinis]
MLILQGTMPQMHLQGSKSGVTVPKLIPNMQVFHADETCRGVVALLWYDPSLDPLMQVRVQFRKSVSYLKLPMTAEAYF